MRYFQAVLVLLFAGFFVSFSASGQPLNGQASPQNQFPDLQQFSVSIACVVPGKPYLVSVVKYFHDDSGKEPVENQWFGTTTDTRNGKKFGQWIFKSNGKWIVPDKGPAGRLFFYTPFAGWKEVDYEKFSQEIRQNFNDEERMAIQQQSCPR